MKEHRYKTTLRWTGNNGTGTDAYNSYSRNHELSGAGKSMVISASSDPHFRGEPTRYNPEELLVSALSSCHMLSYLHLCAVNGVVVTAYEDDATGLLAEDSTSGKIREVALSPVVTITAASDRDKALHLHEEASKLCFIARSVNFPVTHAPRIK